MHLRYIELDLTNIYLAPTMFQVFSESLLCVFSYLSLITNLSGKLTIFVLQMRKLKLRMF